MNDNQQENTTFGDAHMTVKAFLACISVIGIAILISLTTLTALVIAEKNK